MSDNIDKDEIRKAIDRLQVEHPVHFAYDATRIVEPSLAKAVQDEIDRVAKSIAKDASIHIICEMAKLYLDGVKPTIEPRRSLGEWIPCSERLPRVHDYYLVQTDGSHNDVIDIAEFGRLWSKSCEDFGWGWNKASKVIAWMPLPEPYNGGEAE